MSGFVGTVVEAWDELRIHKLRVLLALIGVAVAVTAITGVTAIVQMLNQATHETAERQTGRSVTLDISAYPRGATAPSTAQYTAEFDRLVERYGIEHASRQMWTELPFRFPTGSQPVQMQVVDPSYGTIMRLVPEQGRWFTDADTGRYAPAVVVNEAFLESLGATDLSGHPTVLLGGETPVRTEVIGVYPNMWPEAPPEAYLLFDHYERWATPSTAWGPVAPTLKAWVPPDLAEEMQPLLMRDLRASLPGTDVNVMLPNEGWGAIDGAMRWAALGIGAIALLLGGLGLVNIALVTVRHRIREIGIRRSFGATSGRIFFGVLMESVVATVVAGLVGIVVAVAIIKNLPIERALGTGIQDMPPFPVSAALVGMACATGVGALAGLIPATVAVRVKVIDAIRY
ncbi:ABC transporter permease [Cellulomonas cellasea]|uniref:Putative ABC transport system permease protein n=1 Tax=Cellulomonas cellasea TaxID=43670 RepID=A0A7W4UF87_9CELL|nr:ABC transporter permease [Cellulomonas cellasea]MBB2922684.1 putative ABC transport system permease protein [Cellulomonas cellasea]